MQLTHRSMIAIVMGVCVRCPRLPAAAEGRAGYLRPGAGLAVARRRRTGDCPRETSEDLYARIVPIWVSDVEAWPANSTSVNAATGEHDAKTHRSHAIPPAFHQLTCLMAPETMSVIGPIIGGRSPYRVRVRPSRSSLITVACSHRLASMHVCCTVASACTAGAQTGLGFRYGCGRP